MLAQVLSLLPSLENVPPAALSLVESSPQAQASLLGVEAAETQSQGQGAHWPQGLFVCLGHASPSPFSSLFSPPVLL